MSNAATNRLTPLWARLLALWPLKMIGTTLGMAVFFAAYFWVLRHPQYPVTVMPLTAVDPFTFRSGSMCRWRRRC
jgi:hypothetical protein